MCPEEPPASQDGSYCGASWTPPGRCTLSGTVAPGRCTWAPPTNGDHESDTWPWCSCLWWPSCKSDRSGPRQELAWHFQPWGPQGLEGAKARRHFRPPAILWSLDKYKHVKTFISLIIFISQISFHDMRHNETNYEWTYLMEHLSNQDGLFCGASWTRSWKCTLFGTVVQDRSKMGRLPNGDPQNDFWLSLSEPWCKLCRSNRPLR